MIFAPMVFVGDHLVTHGAIAMVYRLMFSMYRRVSCYTAKGPLSWGIAKLPKGPGRTKKHYDIVSYHAVVFSP